MPETYLKAASSTPETTSAAAREVVAEMLACIETDGEKSVRGYAKKLGQWDGEVLVSVDEMERRTSAIPTGIRRDIEFATAQVRKFAEAPRAILAGYPCTSSSRP